MAKRKANKPKIKLPSRWTNSQMRVNEKGEVQIRVNPNKLGSGGRFAKGVKSIKAEGGAKTGRVRNSAYGAYIVEYKSTPDGDWVSTGRFDTKRGSPGAGSFFESTGMEEIPDPNQEGQLLKRKR